MANTSVLLKKSGTTGNTPATLSYGELALNYADGKLFYKHANGSIASISTGSGTTTDSFATINANSSLILASSPYDTLSIVPGNNITISTDTISKTITINSTATGGGGSTVDQYARDKANSSITLNDQVIYLGNTANIGRIWGTDYNNPNMVVPNGPDTAWAYGMYGNDPEYFLQAKFWGGDDTNHGFRVWDTHTNTAPFLVDGTGTTYTKTFKADSVNVNNVYTLPTYDGINGQALVTNGAGTVSWESITAGGGGGFPFVDLGLIADSATTMVDMGTLA